MKVNNLSCIAISVCLYCSSNAQSARADELTELKKELQSLKQTVQGLKETTQRQQQVIDSFTSGTGMTSASHESKQPPPFLASSGSASKTAVPFIPDIGVVADVTGSLSESEEDEEGNDRISVREVELVLGHDIDPYSRLDATITFSDFEDVDIEEAYVSYWDLPGDLKGRIGRIRPKIGKASALHRDSLDTTDEPFVVQRYFGVEGFFRTGLELTGFSPLSNDLVTQQLTAGILEGGAGEDGTIFGTSRRHPSLYTHLSNYFELSDVNNFELGGSYLLGSNKEDSEFKTNVFGLDASYNYFVTPLNKFRIVSEAYFQKRNDEDETNLENPISSDDHPWGFYALADYRLSERWGIGSRYDYVELINNPSENPPDEEKAVTAYLTFYQSEFARWRAQYQHALLSDGKDDDRFFLQGTFAIGTHKHQLQ